MKIILLFIGAIVCIGSGFFAGFMYGLFFNSHITDKDQQNKQA